MQDKQEGQSELVIFEEAGRPVEVRLDAGGDTVWLSQRQMAELFETTPENVLMHLKNIFRDRALNETATAKEFLAVQIEGRRQVRRNIRPYNLDAIISVGYSVSSADAVRFRQWAARLLQRYDEGLLTDRGAEAGGMLPRRHKREKRWRNWRRIW